MKLTHTIKKGVRKALHTQKQPLIRLMIIAALLGMWGCTVFTPEKRLTPADELPPAFSLYSQTESRPAAWWARFGSPELERLVTRALGHNFSIREAKARLDQARAVAAETGAQRLPQLEMEAEAATLRTRTERSGETSAQEYSLGIGAGYEIDLWGRVASELQAARLDRAAVAEDLFTASMSVAGEVAQAWLGIIGQRMELEILEQQLETNRTLQELVDLRFRKGMVSALDVYQQKQAVAGITASIPLVRLQETELSHQLTYLLGNPPKTDLNIGADKFPELKALPAIGIPADLLANRPDVRAAGLRLRSADWSVAAARADRLPALRLTAQAAYSSNEVQTLFDNWILNLMGSLTGPIFDGNRRKAEVLRTRAVARERVAAYGKVVFAAVKEVEDALVRETRHREHLSALEQELTVSQSALREARERYMRGLNDYLPVLTQLLSNQRLERDILQMKRQLISDRIDLYRSLGGQWETDTAASIIPLKKQKES